MEGFMLGQEEEEMLMERYALAEERIFSMNREEIFCLDPDTAHMILQIQTYLKEVCIFFSEKEDFSVPDFNFLTDDCRGRKELQGLLSFLCAELSGAAFYAWEGNLSHLTILLELFIEVFCGLRMGYEEGLTGKALYRSLKEILYYYIFDYAPLFIREQFHEMTDKEESYLTVCEKSARAEKRLFKLYEAHPAFFETVGLIREIDGLSEKERDLWAGLLCAPFKEAGKVPDRLTFFFAPGCKRIADLAVRRFGELGISVNCPLIRVSPFDAFLQRFFFKDTSLLNNAFVSRHEKDLGYFLDMPLFNRLKEAFFALYEEKEDPPHNMTAVLSLKTFGAFSGKTEASFGTSYYTKRQKSMIGQLENFIGQINLPYFQTKSEIFSTVFCPDTSICGNYAKIFNETFDANSGDYGKYRENLQKIMDGMDKYKYCVVKGRSGNLTNLEGIFLSITEKEACFLPVFGKNGVLVMGYHTALYALAVRYGIEKGLPGRLVRGNGILFLPFNEKPFGLKDTRTFDGEGAAAASFARVLIESGFVFETADKECPCGIMIPYEDIDSLKFYGEDGSFSALKLI